MRAPRAIAAETSHRKCLNKFLQRRASYAYRQCRQFLIQPPDDEIDLEVVERKILRQALGKHGGNQTRTVQRLNITRSALIYRMQKYGLQQPEL